MSETLSISPPVLPLDACYPGGPQGEQLRANAYFAGARVTIPSGLLGIVMGTTTPTVDQQSYAWLKLDTNGAYINLFTFSGGVWVAPHPIPPSSSERILWADSLANLALYQGGDAGAITPTTGAFWVEDTDFTDKIPKGAGVEAVNTNGSELSSGASGSDQVRGIYFAKRTARIYYTA